MCSVVICDDILKVYDPKKKKKVVFFGCYFCLLTVKFSESEIAPLLIKNYHTYVDSLRWNFWMFRLEKTMYILIVIYKKSYKKYIYTEGHETSTNVSSPSPSTTVHVKPIPLLFSPAPHRGPLAVLELRGGEAAGFYYKTFINIVSNKKTRFLKKKTYLMLETRCDASRAPVPCCPW